MKNPLLKSMRTVWVQRNYTIPQNVGFSRAEVIDKAIEMLGSKKQYERYRRQGHITVTKMRLAV